MTEDPDRAVEKEGTGEAVLVPVDFAFVQNAEKNCLISKALSVQPLNALIAVSP